MASTSSSSSSLEAFGKMADVVGDQEFLQVGLKANPEKRRTDVKALML